MLSIGTFSRLSGLSIKALRLYDALHLLCPAEVDRRTGYRRYRSSQIADAHRILSLRQMGMPLGEVQRGRSDRAELLTLRRALERQMENLASQLAAVDLALSEQPCADAPAVVLKYVQAAIVPAQRRTLANFDDADAVLDEWCNLQPSSVRGAIWHDCGALSGKVDVELFLVDAPRRSAHDKTARHSALRVASCLHGANEGAAQSAYATLQHWLAHVRYRRAGPYREIYYRADGGTELTEVQLPIVPCDGGMMGKECSRRYP